MAHTNGPLLRRFTRLPSGVDLLGRGMEGLAGELIGIEEVKKIP